MGALYGDTQATIYEFDNKKEQLRFSPSYYSFMQRFLRVLQYHTNYQLALFLEKFNTQGDTTNLLVRIENVSKRSSLDQFYQVLSSFYKGTCFKTIKKITPFHGALFWRLIALNRLFTLQFIKERLTRKGPIWRIRLDTMIS